VKLATLLIRTIAKPISGKIKEQARQHERFRGLCVNLAQFMYRSEVRLRTNILGEPPRHIRPLSEAKAIENGANTIAEGFLFAVAAALILGESWRSSRNQSKRRDSVDDQLDELGTKVTELSARVDSLIDEREVEMREEKMRNEKLSRILEQVVEIGLRGGWGELQDTPLQIPRIQLPPHLTSSSSISSSSVQNPSLEPENTNSSSSSSNPLLKGSQLDDASTASNGSGGKERGSSS